MLVLKLQLKNPYCKVIPITLHLEQLLLELPHFSYPNFQYLMMDYFLIKVQQIMGPKNSNLLPSLQMI